MKRNLFFASLMILSINFRAGSQWIPTNGPSGGKIPVLFSGSSAMLAGTYGGKVWYSNNKGKSWSYSNTGLSNNDIKSFVEQEPYLYMITSAGFSVSFDYGANWSLSQSGLPSKSVSCLVVKNNKLFLGVHNNGIWSSINNGANWQQCDPNDVPASSNFSISSFLVFGNSIFAYLSHVYNQDRILKSTDNGLSWLDINANIAIRPQSLIACNTKIIARTAYDGVLVSEDECKSWKPMNAGLNSPLQVQSITVIDTIIYAGTNDGIFYCSEKDTIWNQIISNLPTKFIYSLASSDSMLYAGTDGSGIFVSSDYGLTWKDSNVGLNSSNILSLAVNKNKVFAGSGSNIGNIFSTDDEGATWTNENIDISTCDILCLATQDTIIHAGVSRGGVITSQDEGHSWKRTFPDSLSQLSIRSILIDGDSLFVVSYDKIYLSNNRGINWTPIKTNPVSGAGSISVLLRSGINLFAGTSMGFFRSTNNGDSWVSASFGLTNSNITALSIIQGTNDSIKIFAGTENGGIFLTTNNGTSWTTVNSGLTNTNVRVLFASGTNLFAGTNGGVFLSTNNGTNWTSTSNGLTNTSVQSLTISGINLFAGTDGYGVWKRPLSEIIKYGITFNSNNVNIGTVKVGEAKDAIITITNTGNDNLIINSITSDNPSFSARPSVLTIATGASATDTIRFAPTTEGNVVGKIFIVSNAPSSPDTIIVTANGSVTDVKNIVVNPKEYTLSQNYPNPYNPSTTIQFGLPVRSSVKLIIYDILGRAVANLVNAEQQAGIQSVVWNADVASGLYFYRLEAVSLDNPGKRFVETKKMLLLR